MSRNLKEIKNQWDELISGIISSIESMKEKWGDETFNIVKGLFLNKESENEYFNALYLITDNLVSELNKNNLCTSRASDFFVCVSDYMKLNGEDELLSLFISDVGYSISNKSTDMKNLLLFFDDKILSNIYNNDFDSMSSWLAVFYSREENMNFMAQHPEYFENAIKLYLKHNCFELLHSDVLIDFFVNVTENKRNEFSFDERIISSLSKKDLFYLTESCDHNGHDNYLSFIKKAKKEYEVSIAESLNLLDDEPPTDDNKALGKQLNRKQTKRTPRI